MIDGFIFIGVLAIFAVIVLSYVIYVQKLHKKLSVSVKNRIRMEWGHLRTIRDPASRVLEAEKIVDGLLKNLGYEGTFADKLKKAGPMFTNDKTIWAAHRLRNQIAHETGMKVSTKESDRAVASFKSVVRKFVRL